MKNFAGLILYHVQDMQIQPSIMVIKNDDEWSFPMLPADESSDLIGVAKNAALIHLGIGEGQYQIDKEYSETVQDGDRLITFFLAKIMIKNYVPKIFKAAEYGFIYRFMFMPSDDYFFNSLPEFCQSMCTVIKKDCFYILFKKTREFIYHAELQNVVSYLGEKFDEGDYDIGLKIYPWVYPMESYGQRFGKKFNPSMLLCFRESREFGPQVLVDKEYEKTEVAAGLEFPCVRPFKNQLPIICAFTKKLTKPEAFNPIHQIQTCDITIGGIDIYVAFDDSDDDWYQDRYEYRLITDVAERKRRNHYFEHIWAVATDIINDYTEELWPDVGSSNYTSDNEEELNIENLTLF